MDSLNSLNQPVAFYTKNTGNNINTIVDSENRLYQNNVFSPELNEQLTNKNVQKPFKKRKKNKRLNTIDSEYLADEIIDSEETEDENNNFFINNTNENKFLKKLKLSIEFFIENTPLINYFVLKNKEYKIAKTVKTLNDISQNVDELINTKTPYGEEKKIYSDIAKNLTQAANIIGKSNKI